MFKRIVEKTTETVGENTGDTALGRTDLKSMWRFKHKSFKTKEKFTIYSEYKNWLVLWWREFGAERHIISGNPLLHFYWEKKNRWVKTPQVRHPGIIGHFMLTKSKIYFWNLFDRYGRELTREINSLMEKGVEK
jgi:hypothetical protein